MADIRLSVIVPVYNAESTLARCLDSILNQSLKELEIIVVDDLSTDDSCKLVETYQSRFPQRAIRLYTNKCKGRAGAGRNLGLRNARGDYVGFVDSDDWLDTNMYSALVGSASKSDADVAVCGVLREYGYTRNSEPRYVYPSANVITGRFALSLLARTSTQDISISAICCNKVFRRDYLERYQLEFIENRSNEDDYFTFLALLHAKNVSIVPDVYYHYYQRPDSSAHTVTSKSIDNLVYAFRKIKEYLEEDDAFEEYKPDYYSFFEKCLTFLLEMLFQAEQSVEGRTQIIKHLVATSNGIIDVYDFIESVGPRRIRKFFMG